ncbi:MAG: phosphate acetyltransferase, partial [Verrucomicrobia bacterium]
MPLIPKLIEKLQRHPKRVVFAEGADPRIIQAARQWVTRRMGVPILLGDRAAIKEVATKLDVNLQGMRVIEPARSEDFKTFVTQLEQIRRFKGLREAEAVEALKNSGYFGTMMVVTGQADALISGGTIAAASALRPIFQIIPRHTGVDHASSLMILDFDEKKVGSDGALFLSDCGVIPDPTAAQLCDIALSTASIARHLTGEVPRVAML